MTGSREDVLREAESWIGTPFHWNACVKGKQGGVDCARFIAANFEACNVFKAEEWGFFGKGWHLNTDVDHYGFRMLRNAVRLPVGEIGKPADIVLSRVGRVFSHAGIVIAWPKLIHADPRLGVRVTDADFDPMWMGWEKAFFDPWAERSGDVQRSSV